MWSLGMILQSLPMTELIPYLFVDTPHMSLSTEQQKYFIFHLWKMLFKIISSYFIVQKYFIFQFENYFRIVLLAVTIPRCAISGTRVGSGETNHTKHWWIFCHNLSLFTGTWEHVSSVPISTRGLGELVSPTVLLTGFRFKKQVANNFEHHYFDILFCRCYKVILTKILCLILSSLKTILNNQGHTSYIL